MWVNYCFSIQLSTILLKQIRIKKKMGYNITYDVIYLRTVKLKFIINI